METIPVIDLKGGVVVHASGGHRDAYRPIRTPLSAGSTPADIVGGLLGLFRFRHLYVADLDAIERVGDHSSALRALAATWPGVEFWIDAGVAGLDAARAWLDRGIGCLVLGSELQPDLAVAEALRDDPRIILSLDFRGDDFLGPPGLLEQPELWPARVIVMTLGRVGSSAGPDFSRVAKFSQLAPGRQIFAAGGVRNVADLKTLAVSGAAGALVATALHSGAVTGRDLAELDGASMQQVRGIDHVAITVADLDACCDFYGTLLGAQTVAEHGSAGKIAVRQIALGGAVLSIHQSGNGLDLVARRPTVGAADFCLRWAGPIDGAVSLLREHGVAIVEGPVQRRTADGLPSQSVYFRDPDGNLLELMAAD